jgi:hypothetical protein
MSGAAFIALVVQWQISVRGGDMAFRIALSTVPWAIGSLAGIAIADRRDRSTLVGAIVGGTLGTFICPSLIGIYLYLNGLNGIKSLNGVWWQLAFAACGGGLLAAFIDIPRRGLTLRRKRSEIERFSSGNKGA